MYYLILNTNHNFRITRKGVNRTLNQWLQRLQPYITEWETATTRIWNEDAEFDIHQFNAYLRRYMARTRLRIIEHSHPEEIPVPATGDTYPSFDTSGSRQYAVTYILFTKCI